MRKRFASLVALVASASLMAQVIIAFSNLQLLGGTYALAAWRLLGFFTILTNLLIVLAMAMRSIGHWPRSYPDERHVLGSLTVAIILVGLVYHAVLARLWNPVGFHWWSDQGLHTAVPILFFAYWLAFAPKAGLRWVDAARWMIYPAGYGAYALARGAIDGWYPYPFIDVGQLGYATVMTNILGLAIAVGLGALVLIAYARGRERSRTGA